MSAKLLSVCRALAVGDAEPLRAALAADDFVTRTATADEFLEPIKHYIYAGDTALHIAAAAYHADAVRMLLAAGASPAAANRRGAQPLHYACDGGPDTASWNPAAQERVIALLVGAGADVEARDKSGVAPLHRAVRCRCGKAVQMLLAAGADPDLPNRKGSRPIDLARATTGKSGAGSAACKREQALIVQLLEARSR